MQLWHLGSAQLAVMLALTLCAGCGSHSASGDSGGSGGSGGAGTGGAAGAPTKCSTCITLATGLGFWGGIAVDAVDVYFATGCSWTAKGNGALMRVPREGGPVTTLVSGLDCPAGVAVDADNVYWADTIDGQISKIPKTGGAPVVIASSQVGPMFIAIDDANVYWGGKGVTSVPKTGGAPHTLCDGTGGWNVALDSTKAYFTSQDEVAMVALTGGTAVPLAQGQKYPYQVAVDPSYVYWTVLSDAAGGGYVGRVPKGGGAVEVIVQDQSGADAIRVDSSGVYWGKKSALMVQHGAGEVPTALATGYDVYPVDLATDADSVYWVNSSGSVMNVAK